MVRTIIFIIMYLLGLLLAALVLVLFARVIYTLLTQIPS